MWRGRSVAPFHQALSPPLLPKGRFTQPLAIAPPARPMLTVPFAETAHSTSAASSSGRGLRTSIRSPVRG